MAKITITRMVRTTVEVSDKEVAKYVTEAKIWRGGKGENVVPVLDLYCKNSDPGSSFIHRCVTISAPDPKVVDWDDPDALLAYGRANLPDNLDLTSF
jgi:hypothetical protein